MSTISDKFYSGGNGVPYTKEITGTPHTDIANNTYFKDLSDGLVYYKNASGLVISMFEAPGAASGASNTSNTLHVMDTGNDATALAAGRHDMNAPFLTLESARDNSVAGDTIVVWPGTYVVTTTDATGLCADGVNWYFHPNANVSKVTANPIFHTIGMTSGCNVMGYGNFSGSVNMFTRGADLPSVVEFNSYDGTHRMYEHLLNTGITNTTRVKAHTYIKTTASYALQAITFGTTYIEAQYIENNSAGISAIRMPNHNCTLVVGTMVNLGGGNCYEGGTINHIKGNYIERINSSGVIDVANMLVMTSNDQVHHTGYCATINHGGGHATYGECAAFNGTGSGEATVHFKNTPGNSTFTSAGGEGHYYLYNSTQIGTQNNSSRTFTVSGVGSNVHIMGSWRVFNHPWTISAGTVYVEGKFFHTSNTAQAHPFTLTGTGKLVVNGEIETARTSSALISMDAGGTTELEINGGILTTLADMKVPPILALNAAQTMIVNSDGLTTNYSGHVLSANRFITNSYQVTANTGSFTLDDGTNAPIGITSGATGSPTDARDALVIDVNAAAPLNYTASPDPNNTDIFFVTCDIFADVVTATLLTNLTEVNITTFATYGISNPNGGPIVQPGVFRLGTSGYGFPLTSGTLGQILQVDAAGDLVYGAVSAGSVTTDNVIYVAENGAPTGVINDLTAPFRQLAQAAAAAVADGGTFLVVVYPGTYTEAASVATDKVDWYFHKGATVTFTAAGGGAYPTVDSLFDVTHASGGNVYGRADFIINNSGVYVYEKAVDRNLRFECNSCTGPCATINLSSVATTMTVYGSEFLDGTPLGPVIRSGVACNWNIECPLITCDFSLPTVYTRGSSTQLKFTTLNNTTSSSGFDNASGGVNNNVVGLYAKHMYLTGESTVTVAQVDTLYGHGNIKFVGHCTNYLHVLGNFEGGVIEFIEATFSTATPGSIKTTIGTLSDAAGGSTTNIGPFGSTTRSIQVELKARLGTNQNKAFNIDGGASTNIKLVDDWVNNDYVFNVSSGTLELDGNYKTSVAGLNAPFILTGTAKMIVSGEIEMVSTLPAITKDPGTELVFNGGMITTIDNKTPPIKLLTSAQNYDVQSDGFSTNYTGHNMSTTLVKNVSYIITTTTIISLTIDGIVYQANTGTAAGNAAACATGVGMTFPVGTAIPNCIDLTGGMIRIVGTTLAPDFVAISLSANISQFATYTIGDTAAVSVDVAGVTYSSNAGSAAANATALAVASVNIRDLGGVFSVDNLTNAVNFTYGTALTSNIVEGTVVNLGTFGMNNTFGGPIVQEGVFRLGANGYGFPLASGTAGQVLQVDSNLDLVYATNLASVITTNMVHLSTTGNDGTGSRHDLGLPFLTAGAAKAAALAGDVIVVQPGVYHNVIVAGGLLKEGVNWYFHPGAIFTQQAAAPAVAMFTNIGLTTGGNVYGYGEFQISSAATYAYERQADIPTTFEFEKCYGFGAFNKTAGAINTFYIHGHSFMDATGATPGTFATAAASCIRLAVTCNVNIVCPMLVNNAAASPTINVLTDTGNISITCDSIVNNNGGAGALALSINIGAAQVALAESSIGNITARHISKVSLLGFAGSFNVGLCDELTCEYSEIQHHGLITNYTHVSGAVHLDRIEDLTAGAVSTGEIWASITNLNSSILVSSANSVRVYLSCNNKEEVSVNDNTHVVTVSGAGAEIFLEDGWRVNDATFTVSNGKLTVCGTYYSENVTSPFVLTGTGKMVLSGSIDMATAISAINKTAGTELVFDGGTITTVNDVTPPIYMNTGAQAVEIRGGGFTTNYTGNLSGTIVQSHDYLIGDAASANITVGGTLYTSNAGSAVANAAAFDSGGAVPIPNCTDQGGGVFRIVGADSDTNFVVTLPSANLTETINATFGTFAMNNTFGGPIVQPGVFRLGTSGYGFPLASGTAGQVLQVDAAGDLAFSAAASDAANNGAIGLVSPDGDDLTGIIGNPSKPFKTLIAARDAAKLYKKRKFHVTTGAILTDITLDDGVNAPATFSSNLGTTAAADAAAIVAAINAANGGGTLELTASQDDAGSDDYFYVNAVDSTVAFDSTTTAPTNLWEGVNITIQVAPGYYVVETSDTYGLSWSGLSWYFSPGTNVSKESTGFPLQMFYNRRLFTDNSNVLGYGNFTITGNGGGPYIWHSDRGGVFEADNVTSTCAVNGPIYMSDLTSGVHHCTVRKTLSVASGIGVYIKDTDVVCNLNQVVATGASAGIFVDCNYAANSVLLNVASVTSLASVGITVGSGTYNIGKAVSNTSVGIDIGGVTGQVALNVGYTNKIRCSASVTAKIAFNGYAAELDMGDWSSWSSFTGGVVKTLIVSAGRVDTTLSNESGASVTLNPHASGGTPYAIVHMMNFGTAYGNFTVSDTNATGKVPTLVINGPANTMGYTPTTSTITAGIVKMVGDFTCDVAAVDLIDLNGGTLDLGNSRFTTTVDNTSTAFNNIVKFQSGTLVSNGATFVTPLTSPNAWPIIATAAQNITVLSGGMNSNKSASILPARSQVHTITLAANAVTTIVLNGITYTTTAQGSIAATATDLANVQINGDNPSAEPITAFDNGDGTFTLTADVAGTTFTQAGLVNCSSVTNVKNSFAITNNTGGLEIADANVL